MEKVKRDKKKNVEFWREEVKVMVDNRELLEEKLDRASTENH